VEPTSFSVANTGFYGPSFSVPEPSGVVLAAFGLAGLAACGWRRQKRSRA
jgi:PEP-CTERM motif